MISLISWTRCRAVAVALVALAGSAWGLSDRGNLQFAQQTWRTENGLPQNTVHAILQTRDGYLWLATEGGVVRFDGIRFVVFDRQNTPALKSNNIRALAEDRMGALWIASAAGLVRFRGTEATTFTTQQGLPNNNVWAVEADEQGSVWAATTDGLARWNHDGFAQAGPGSIRALAVNEQGLPLIATQNGGIESFRNNQFAQVLAGHSETDVLLSDTGRRIWLGTPQGLLLVDGSKTKLYTTRDGLPSSRVTALFEDRERCIWVGTDRGMARIVNSKIEHLSSGDALAGEMVLSFYEDREGDLWAGTESGGVTVLREQKFTTYSDAESSSGEEVRCVLADRSGTVWMGTGGQGLRRLAAGKFSAFTTQNGLSSDQVFALDQDTNGDVLVGTPDGLNRIHDGGVSVLTSADGLADDFVRSIFRDSDGSLWMGTRRGLSHWKQGRFETYTQRDGLGGDLVGAVLRSKNGALWIGTLGGLSRFENGKFTNFRTAKGLSNDVITSLYEDGRGTLWVGTDEGGLNRYRDGTFTAYGTKDGLPQAIYGITEDSAGGLWMAASTGVYRARTHDLDQYAAGERTEISVVSYGTSDGLRISECTGGGHPAVWKGRDGALWFATPKGAALLRSAEVNLNRVPPPVAIEGVSVDDRSYDPASFNEVSPGHTRLSFEYAGLSFVAPQKVRFRYKLEGFDREWVDAGTRRVAYYTNIPAGNYRFRVSARNNDGMWNERGATLRFRMLPHFYQTFWFGALTAGMLCLLGYGVYRWRVSEVEARFSAVLEERNRIAREIHDTLAQGFVAVSVQLEIVAQLLNSSKENAREHLNQARGLVRESLSEARTAIWELRSQAAGSEDLAARLSKMAAQVTASSSVKARVDVRGTYRPLRSAVEDQLVKIGQEAVTNAVRHAGAANVAIELAFESKKLRMTVVDDGRGFAPDGSGRGPEGHFGLQGMRERAAQIRAELTVESKPGEGTRVSVEATAG